MPTKPTYSSRPPYPHFIISFRGYALLATSLLFVASLLSSNPVSAESNPLTQQLERIKDQACVGAVAYALVEGNKIVTMGGIGSYGNDNDRPVTEASLFRIGSITKTFTSLAIMRLVDQGKCQLDQPIKTIVRDSPLHNPWSETPVTLAMLLEHTAGLQDLTREEFDYPEPLSLQDALNLKPETRKVHWPPGYHYSYSNLGAGYVGRAIEIITKEEYDTWFEGEILAVLDMRDSQLHWTKTLEQSLVSGYDADLKTKIPYWHTLFRPFGGLNTTARDMTKFLFLFTDESTASKKLFSASAIKRMETPETTLAAKAGLNTGYGLGIRNTLFKGHRIYGHGGDADGYLAEFAYSKESHRGYFVVINAFRHDILEDFTGPLNDWLIEELAGQPDAEEIASQAPSDPLPRERRLALSGEYREVTTRFPFRTNQQAETVQIRDIDNALFKCRTNTDQCKKILAVTDALFRTEDETDASMAFVKAPDGNLYLQAESGNYQKTNTTSLETREAR
ncbi:MAG: serine hydrolase domain-containing protein [Gammaproteobacteria bacterium]